MTETEENINKESAEENEKEKTSSVKGFDKVIDISDEELLKKIKIDFDEEVIDDEVVDEKISEVREVKEVREDIVKEEIIKEKVIGVKEIGDIYEKESKGKDENNDVKEESADENERESKDEDVSIIKTVEEQELDQVLDLFKVTYLKAKQIDHDNSQILGVIGDFKRRIGRILDSSKEFSESRFEWYNKFGSKYVINKYFELISEQRSLFITLLGYSDNISNLCLRTQQNIDDIKKGIK